VGPRFGGAVDGAAKIFSWGYDTGLTPFEFVEEMRKRKELIAGIGHKVKSIHNPDKRVTILKEFALKHFPAHPVLDYALEVEILTTKKKSNLIFNVDGCIGCCFVDLLRHCGAFTPEEVSDQQLVCVTSMLTSPPHLFLGGGLSQEWIPQWPLRVGKEYRLYWPFPRPDKTTGRPLQVRWPFLFPLTCA